MLERVTLGQTRFAMPGVGPDARGIVLGKVGALLFPALDGVVRWLRLYADEDSLDDLLPGMRVTRVVTPLKSRACLLVIPATSSYVLDRAARCARLAGGAVFTGTTKHFVRYRDDRSPYGYDVADLGAPAAAADFVLHGEEAAFVYAREGELDVATLVMRLSLRRVPGAERLDAEGRAQLYLTVASGLAAGVIRYLLRYRVRAEVSAMTYERRSAFALPGEPHSGLLVRVHALPDRLLGTLRGVPGVVVFRPATDNIAVEVGYAHPIALASVSSIFPRDRFYLFRGAVDRLDIVKGALVFSSAEHLAELRIGRGNAAFARSAPVAPDALGVTIELVPTLAPPRRVVATLVPWEQAARLKKLVYLLPPVLLRGHQIAASTRGILLVADDGVDVVPLGTLLTEVAPGLLIPVGMDLLPRVPTEILAQAIEHQTGAGGGEADAGRRLTVFPHEGGPFFIAGGDLVPLERQILARLPVSAAPAQPDVYGAEGAPPGRIVNDAVGRFALFGFQRRAPKAPKTDDR